jgi:RimJ/RimL family protein N-acetyltransferase
MPFPPIASVATPRLTLRPVAPADLPDLLEINGDPEVTRHLPYATWRSPEDGAAWLERMRQLEATGTAQQLAAVHAADAKVVGTVLLFRFDVGSSRLELGYVLGRRYWRQGLMREALAATCSHAFGAMGIRRIEAEVNPANVPSASLLESIGFRREGRLRKRWVSRGEAYDTDFYGCLAEDWRGSANAA